MKVGIIREGKVPQDKRVPFTPSQCRSIVENYSDIDINSQDINYFNYYLRMEKELTKAISIGLSTRYNNNYNHNLELIIRI